MSQANEETEKALFRVMELEREREAWGSERSELDRVVVVAREGWMRESAEKEREREVERSEMDEKICASLVQCYW